MEGPSPALIQRLVKGVEEAAGDGLEAEVANMSMARADGNQGLD